MLTIRGLFENYFGKDYLIHQIRTESGIKCSVSPKGSQLPTSFFNDWNGAETRIEPCEKKGFFRVQEYFIGSNTIEKLADGIMQAGIQDRFVKKVGKQELINHINYRLQD